MIYYSLIKNTMNRNETEFIANVKQSEETGREEILDYMTAEGSGLTRPQALAYFEKLMQAIEFFIEMRGGLNLPMFRIRTTITGVFRNEDDTFDPDRHQINIRILPGVRLNKLQSRLKVKKEIRPELTPSPKTLIDFITNAKNERVSPGNSAMLKGKYLKLDPEDSKQGIFFIPENDPVTKFRVHFYIEIKPAKIHFVIPSLPAGNYKVIVQAVMRRHKSIRTGVLYSTITVS